MKYLFTVEYTDGTVYKQNKQDISEKDPKRSCFYDVEHSKKKIKRFILSRLWHKYSVDLTDGHFEIDGTVFDVEGETVRPINQADYRLIYFRQHQHDMAMDYKNKTQEEVGHRVTFCIGWQTTIAGKNYKRILYIK